MAGRHARAAAAAPVGYEDRPSATIEQVRLERWRVRVRRSRLRGGPDCPACQRDWKANRVFARSQPGKPVLAAIVAHRRTAGAAVAIDEHQVRLGDGATLVVEHAAVDARRGPGTQRHIQLRVVRDLEAVAVSAGTAPPVAGFEVVTGGGCRRRVLARNHRRGLGRAVGVRRRAPLGRTVPVGVVRRDGMHGRAAEPGRSRRQSPGPDQRGAVRTLTAEERTGDEQSNERPPHRFLL